MWAAWATVDAGAAVDAWAPAVIELVDGFAGVVTVMGVVGLFCRTGLRGLVCVTGLGIAANWVGAMGLAVVTGLITRWGAGKKGSAKETARQVRRVHLFSR